MLKLALGLMAGQAARQAGVTARRMGLMAFAGLLGLVGAGFLTAAGFIALMHHWGPIGAAAGFGAGFVAVALILVLVANRRPARDRALEAQVAGLEAQALRARQEAAAALAAVPDSLGQSIGRSPALPLLGAFAGGLILALKLRK